MFARQSRQLPSCSREARCHLCSCLLLDACAVLRVPPSPSRHACKGMQDPPRCRDASMSRRDGTGNARLRHEGSPSSTQSLRFSAAAWGCRPAVGSPASGPGAPPPASRHSCHEQTALASASGMPACRPGTVTICHSKPPACLLAPCKEQAGSLIVPWC